MTWVNEPKYTTIYEGSSSSLATFSYIHSDQKNVIMQACNFCVTFVPYAISSKLIKRPMI